MNRIKTFFFIVTATAASVCFASDGYEGDSAAVRASPQFQIFSRTAPPSPVSQSFAGAGTAMTLDGFEGLVNPALTNAGVNKRINGIMATGFGRDQLFDDFTLPFAMTLIDKSGNGMMGMYYRYLRGSQGRVHDVVMNFAGTLFGQIDQQGAVEFGANVRYEHSRWQHDLGFDGDGNPLFVSLRGRSLLLDAGFYQPHIAPGLDFAFVFTNLTGYIWTDIDGGERENGWVGGLHRTMILGIHYAIPLLGDRLLLKIPFDLEMANLFSKSVPNKYVARAGAELRIARTYSVRFGYAHAPANPLLLITDFNPRHLFFGGGGVTVNSVQADFFAGEKEFGITITYKH
jgi:hypothetical protein